MKDALPFPCATRRTIRVEVFRYGDLDLNMGISATAYQDALDAARLSGDDVRDVLVRYALRIQQEYFQKNIRPRRGHCR